MMSVGRSRRSRRAGGALVVGLLVAALTGAPAGAAAAPAAPPRVAARRAGSGTTTPSVPELGPYGSVDQLIRQHYVDAARRAPTAAELVAARTALNEHGESAGDFMAVVVSGPGREAQAQELARLYLGELGRLPAYAPFTSWRAMRGAGLPITSVAQIFASSGEFASRFPASLSNTAFVTRLYEKILLRPPDTAGLAGWVHQLVTGTPRWLVALRLIDSPEYRADTAASSDAILAFAVMLLRIPTAAELAKAAPVVSAGGYAAIATKLLDTSTGYAHRFPTPAVATTVQLDPLHDGDQVHGVLAPSPTPRWTAHFDQEVSYPVSAAGRVFVVVGESTTGAFYGDRLYALSAATGETIWGPIDIGSVYQFAALTYENGRVFSLNFGGTVKAFDAATGALDWSAHLGSEYDVDSSPVATGGTVYVQGGYGVYALDEVTGAVRWSGGASGDNSSPVVAGSVLYNAFACEVASAMSTVTAAVLWTHSTDCSGGGGRTAVLHDGALYIRDSAGKAPAILDASTGIQVGTFASDTAPAFDAGTMFTLSSGTLRAVAVPSGAVRWSQTADGALVSAPLVANGRVYVAGSNGVVHGFNEATGAIVWTGTAGSSFVLEDWNATVRTGMAIAGDQLLVPAGNDLTAFGS